MTGKLFEFRDYHYDGDLGEYRAWWEEALPVLSEWFDIVGVWTDRGEPPRITGASPMELPLGSANVTWVIRWDDLEQREETWDRLREAAEWTALAERHPGWDRYLHMSVRFLDEVG
ncbi:MAG: hypothetical protein QNJ12_04950 [Ilumatobacter sp.]|uniref:hypothetical protein n=1 Tax=Ilumatobacter sp. TaxID=1967498 RepID=UPI00260C855A|nr:hypothetical protein [Ilumatobacter sp.]MDJ0768116.1 hypothetical protein [Ilumatobacter sp.]